MGQKDYFQNGGGDGAIVLILGAVSLVFVLANIYKPLLLTGVGSIAILSFIFVNILDNLSQKKAGLDSDLKGNPFNGLAYIAMDSFQLQWGWAVLFIGAVLVIGSAVSNDDGSYRLCRPVNVSCLLKVPFGVVPNHGIEHHEQLVHAEG